MREDARQWIEAHWDPTLELTTWRRLLHEASWACPTWPRECRGRGLPGWADDIVQEELAAAGAVGTPPGSGMDLAAPTILAHGSPAQKRTFLPPIVTGADTWCQLFSEPGSGSDLAGLTTTAIRDGDVYVVNGQKVWSTSAHHAAFGMLLARTDWDAPKHQGISWMVLPMHQPGVDARPLRQMNGYASFNEVFLSDAVVPVDNVVGRLGEGWPIALTTIAQERGFGSGRRRDFCAGGRALEEAEAEGLPHDLLVVSTASRESRPRGRAMPGRPGAIKLYDRQSLELSALHPPINGRQLGLGRTASSIARRDRKAPSASSA